MVHNTPTKTASPRKRQQKLTSFFNSTSSTGSSATLLNKDIKLAPDVQSGLLNVGMRIRKSVPEGYKSGTYAFNKHLPSTGAAYIGIDTPPSSQESNASTESDFGVKKRSFDEEEEEEEQTRKGLELPPTSALAMNRKYKMPSSKRVHHKAIARGSKDISMVDVVDDFDEAGFLRPVEDMEQ
ncbi:hypothetical protein EDC01DRAFT_217368 [Geopyxis carbonaria]|nr:hypothetical protein EDC01DRAFT_217368 [Geopyxis carbonaria]